MLAYLFTMAWVFGGLGFMIMVTVAPYEWQNLKGWLIISYVGIPLFFVLLALLVNVPALLFGLLFFLGFGIKK